MHSKTIEVGIRRYPELAKYLNRPYSDRPAEVLPTVYSNDQRLINLARDVSDGLKDIKPNIKDGFLLEPYILGNFDAVRQLAGFNSNPLGSKPPEQEQKTEIDPTFFEFLAKVTKLMTSNCAPSGISINKISSIGFPDRVNDLVVKSKSVKFFINNFDRIAKYCDLTAGGKKSIDDWIGEFDFAPISLEGRRSQHTDGISREGSKFVPRLREVFDWTGKKVTTTRSIKDLSDFFRTRSRFVYGATGHLNYGAQFFATSIRNFMAHKYDFMFYTGPHNFAEKTRDFDFMISADVTQFDQNFDQRVADTIIDNIYCYDDDVKNLMRTMVAMPVVQKNDYIGQKGFKVSSDTASLNLPSVSSNPSGWAWVTEFAKIVGVTLMVCAVNRILKVTDDNLDDLLLGKLPIAFLNTGDDMVFLFRNSKFYADFKTVNKEMQFYRFKLEIESVVNYLGMSLRRDSSGTSPLLDIRNIVIKTHVPERSVGSVHKPFFAFGLRSKLDIYANHPAFHYVFGYWNNLFKKNFGLDLLQFVKLDKLPKGNIEARNIADQVFMENPDSIHYKIKPGDISKDLLDQYYVFVDRSHFANLEKHLRGKIVI